jgi:hypothetical protein
MNNATFGDLHRLLKGLGFVQVPANGPYILFEHKPSDTLLPFRQHRPDEQVDAMNLAVVRKMLDERGLLERDDFESALRDTPRETAMTVNLTEEMRQALDAQPQVPVRVVDARTNITYVLVRADLYERVKPLLEEEEFDVRAMYPHLAKVFGPAGWDDPAMDVYNELDPRRKS